MRTLILNFHPQMMPSRTNVAMTAAADALAGVETVDMYALYPLGTAIDVDAEAERLFGADRLVLQFPVHWYAPPPLLADWQNHVLTRMFYIRAEAEGARIEGLPLMVAATAGNVPEAYAPEGVNLFPLEDLLKPLHSTAHRCGLAWTEPFLVYRADKIDDDARARVASAFAARLAAWDDRIDRSETK